MGKDPQEEPKALRSGSLNGSRRATLAHPPRMTVPAPRHGCGLLLPATLAACGMPPSAPAGIPPSAVRHLFPPSIAAASSCFAFPPLKSGNKPKNEPLCNFLLAKNTFLNANLVTNKAFASAYIFCVVTINVKIAKLSPRNARIEVTEQTFSRPQRAYESLLEERTV